MKLTFLGAAETVTGSCYLLETGDSKILIDCGMFQGPRKLEELNRLNFQFDAKEIDFLLLTHAHIDHSGMIPKLIAKGFNAPIICSAATKDLCEIMLPDSAYIQEEEIKWSNRKRMRAGKSALEPVYTADDALESIKYFQPLKYAEKQQLTQNVQVCFQDAGHILGSGIIELWVNDQGEEKKIVFSGDIGNSNQAIVKDPSIIKNADYILLETTYANRHHKSRAETVEEFKNIITTCIADGGNIVIPSFAVERTQELIYELGEMRRQKILPDIPVYIDSPLAISATDIFRKHPECYDLETWDILKGGENPLDLPTLKYTRTVEESRRINAVDGAIIMSASGMCHAGRIKHHLKHNLWRPESHIIFVGYQAEGTLGRSIIEGAKQVKIFGEEIAVKAHIHTLGGFSAHADQSGLINWLEQFQPRPRKVFLTHGELQSMEEFRDLAVSKHHMDIQIPAWLEQVEI